jgi:hypothetical protein
VNRLLLITIIVATTSCSTMIPRSDDRVVGTVVEVHVHGAGIYVPTAADIEAHEAILAEEMAKSNPSWVLDPHEPIIVEWHAQNEVFAVRRAVAPPGTTCQNPRVVANGVECDYFILSQTINTHHIQVSSWALFNHEMTHVMLWRVTGDPDSDHENGHGPWTSETNEMINRATSRMANEQE